MNNSEIISVTYPTGTANVAVIERIEAKNGNGFNYKLRGTTLVEDSFGGNIKLQTTYKIWSDKKIEVDEEKTIELKLDGYVQENIKWIVPEGEENAGEVRMLKRLVNKTLYEMRQARAKAEAEEAEA